MYRFSVLDLYKLTAYLSKVTSKKIKPELNLSNARILSIYSKKLLLDKEIWISKGRIVCIK